MMRLPVLAALFLAAADTAPAQQLDLDFVITEDGQAAGCAASIVSGLDPNGDGFLAVRTGPGSNYFQVDQLRNGDTVRTCAQQGEWIGVYYGQPRRKGWVHSNWLIDGAG